MDIKDDKGPMILSEIQADEAPSVRRVLELSKGDIINLVMATRKKILWGVYGDHGTLLKVTECRDVDRLTDSDKDAEAFKGLYLKGLLAEPSSFGSTYEIESKKSTEEIKNYLRENYVASVKYSYEDKGERKEKLVGMGVLRRGVEAQSHIANFGRLYVHPAHRKRQLATEIVAHLLDHANKEGIEQIHLVVTASNDFAIKFYIKLGFIPGEMQYKAAKIDDQYYDWLHMSLSMQDYKAEKFKSSPGLQQG